MNKQNQLTYTYEEVRQLAHLTEHDVRRLVREGRLEMLKIGRKALIVGSSLRKLLSVAEAA